MRKLRVTSLPHTHFPYFPSQLQGVELARASSALTYQHNRWLYCMLLHQ